MPESFLVAVEIATPILTLAVGGGVGWIARQQRKSHNRQEYTNARIEAMDYALEHAFKNGYRNRRDSKLEQLLSKSDFINGPRADAPETN